MSLTQIYVDLNTKTQVKQDKAEDQLSPELEEKGMRLVPALEATIQNQHLVILGDPGSGKSTFINYLSYGLAVNLLNATAKKSSFLKDLLSDKRDLIPIQVVLRDFARQLPADTSKAAPNHLWDFIKGRLTANNLTEAKNPLHKSLENGRAMLLFDGLDEIPTKKQRTFVRDAVQAFVDRYRQCRFLVTCRTLSYQDPAWQLHGFPQFELAPFDETQIDGFIHAWYWELVHLQVVKDKQEGNALAKKLSQAVRKPDMWRLAPNPLLLTVMALVHTHKGRLPEARALLYEETIEILLWRWEQIKTSRESELPHLRQLLLEAGRSEVDLKKVLWELAYQAHVRGGMDDDKEALADIDELSLEKALANLKDGDRNWAQKVIETIKLRAGLLLERATGLFTFPHRTFQEYLAGAHLSSQAGFARKAAELIQQGALWREVILLAVGRLVYLSGDTDKPLALVGELCPKRSEDSQLGWRKAWFAGDVLLEMELARVKDSNLGRDLLPCVTERIAQLLAEGKLQPVERASAGRTLAKLGDPRHGVSVYLHERTELPNILWCHIPAGEFWMGSDKKVDRDAFDEEFPQHKLTLPDFYISRYPITHAQFMAFVKAGGYRKPRYWHEAEQADVWQEGKVQGRWDENPRSKPEDFGEPYYLSNHPVVGITWYEALAFCHWLEEQLLHSDDHVQINIWQKENIIQQRLVSKKYKLMLPSEAEWEKAARGEDKRIYPWGKTIDIDSANYRETRIESTSAVGCFPSGVSTYGLVDMSGNVWEWTRSNYEKYPYQTTCEKLDTGRDVARVLRGGSFGDESGGVRCAYRHRNSPSSGGAGVGVFV